MIDSLLESWRLVQLLSLDGFLAGLALAIAAPWVGTLLILRRMPFLGLAIPQLAGAGTALAWFAFPLVFPATFASPDVHDHPPTTFLLVGSTIAIVVGLLILAMMGRGGRATSSQAAIVFLIALAVAEIAWVTGPYPEMAESLARRGRLLTVLAPGRDIVIAASALAWILAISFRRPLWLSAFDRDLTRLKGSRPGTWLMITLLLSGGLAAACVPEIGPEAVLALLLIPPAVLNRASPSLAAYAPLSSLAGVIGTAAAFHVSFARDWPLNPTLILCLLAASLSVSALAAVTARVRRGIQRASIARRIQASGASSS
ncbi:MAG: metal ABC transporter permease [Planctomycetes bacterium]|nr:metal ABC transporter permease [Planctomycetota bacterium]